MTFGIDFAETVIAIQREEYRNHGQMELNLAVEGRHFDTYEGFIINAVEKAADIEQGSAAPLTPEAMSYGLNEGMQVNVQDMGGTGGGGEAPVGGWNYPYG